MLATIDPKVREYGALRQLLLTPKGNSYFRAVKLLEQNYGGADRMRQFYMDAIDSFPNLRYNDVDQLQELIELILETTISFETHDLHDELASRHFADKLRFKLPDQYSQEYQLWIQSEYKNYNKYMFTADTLLEFFNRKKENLLRDLRHKERLRRQAKGTKDEKTTSAPFNKFRAKIAYCDDECSIPDVREASPTSTSSDIEQIYEEDPDREQVFYTSAVTGRKRFAIPACSLCPDLAHLYRHCRKFLAMTPAQRREHLGKLRKCFRCFREGHGIKECKSTIKCKNCGRDHHTLVCPNSKETREGKKNAVIVDSQNNLFPLSHRALQEIDMDVVMISRHQQRTRNLNYFQMEQDTTRQQALRSSPTSIRLRSSVQKVALSVLCRSSR
jgi:hypothetical protein